MDPVRAFEDFRREVPLKQMQIAPRNMDELIQMQPNQGMDSLQEAPISSSDMRFIGQQFPYSAEIAKENRYLWVVSPTDIPHALETCAWGKTLESKVIKHSNLTGGGPAHSGGEIWFVDDCSVIVNANSGRYGARSVDELDAFVGALVKCGYRVASMGFDVDNPNKPNSILFGELEWIE